MKVAAHAAALPLLATRAAACAVCFGKGAKGGNAAGLFDGIWWGIVLLLVTTGSMLCAIAWLFWKVERRRMLQERSA